jgi:DNA polymerase elongation subunit (family B)|tara:strand:+ start:4997 stop:8458 length:3462 start_codon:yes stop_codon:yes gene_type:complete
MKEVVAKEEIGAFLNGRDPQKYIVGVEASNYSNKVHLIINDPVRGKTIEPHRFRPFLWCNEAVWFRLYGGDRKRVKQEIAKAGIKVRKVKMCNSEGHIPDRIAQGYQYLVTGSSKQSINDLQNFFKWGGLGVWDNRDLFHMVAAPEQFMIQTGKRLFKGLEDYDDLHKFFFDLETTGLDPYVDRIFQVGIKDNRGFDHILDVTTDAAEQKLSIPNPELSDEDNKKVRNRELIELTEEEILELNDREMEAINTFFSLIEHMRPDTISGYNSEDFDFNFFVVRCQVLGYDIKEVALTLSKFAKGTDYVEFKRNEKATIKLGQESQRYTQTLMWGFTVLDIAHSVRRAQAINSDIKAWGLKYITQYADAEKPNRVYVQGDKIFTTWADKVSKFAFNESNGDWYKIDPEQISSGQNVIKEGYDEATGKYIVERYLQDDLWETAKVDEIFNQSNFLLGKIVPTPYSRVSTMGTAALWNLLMTAWSYEKGLAIPIHEDKRDFAGGLARLLEVGYAIDVTKLDFAALYPNIMITHDIFPDLDISGVMKGLLIYIAEERDLYKAKKNDAAAIGDNALADRFDKLQLPLKILANSFFGSFGSQFFNWADFDKAEETTCRGRQYLRLMVMHFFELHEFRPLVGDTDGFNFAVPPNINDIKYVSTGFHRFNEKDKEYTGLKAVVAEYNDLYMIGRMGLDIDDNCTSTINFARKNYANNIVKVNKDGSQKIKLKIVGNTFKDKTLPNYIEDFFTAGIPMLLDGKGYEYLNLYYETIDEIYNCAVSLGDIASKSRVKMTIDGYRNREPDKNGKPKAKQAHMELAIKHNLNVRMGDVIYYINTGDRKSHGDMKTVTDKKTGKKEVQFQCRLIPNAWIENPDLIDEDIVYNIPKYLDKFNKRITATLVCFKPEIRDKILVNVKIDKKTKAMVLDDFTEFTHEEAQLTSGIPDEVGDQDTYEDLMTMEDKELRFWTSVEVEPNNLGDLGIDPEKWESIKKDYFVRSTKQRIKQMRTFTDKFNSLIPEIEWQEFLQFRDESEVPPSIDKFFELDEETGSFKEKKTKITVGQLEDIFEMTEFSEFRHQFYIKHKIRSNRNRYDIWVEHMDEIATSEEFDVDDISSLSVSDYKEETFSIVSKKEASRIRAQEKAKAKRDAKKTAANQLSLNL